MIYDFFDPKITERKNCISVILNSLDACRAFILNYYHIMLYQIQQGEYTISTDRQKLNIDVIHGYLKNAYWSKNKPKDLVRKSIKGSICFGVYHQKQQVGFARVITDLATFGYLADVFIVPEYQGKGLGKLLIKTIIECPEFQEFRSWSLATKDAHGLYAKFGFKEMENPKIWMRKVNKTEY